MLTLHRLSRLNVCKYSYGTRFVAMQQRRQIFEWTNNHIIDPLRGISEHAVNYPINLTVGIASICLLSYVLREYVSRKIMYIPHDTFMPSWNLSLRNISYKEIEFKNIIDPNINLHGLYIPGHNKKFSKYPLLFLHGNAGNLTHRIENLLLLHYQIGCDIFIFDYRAYGKSTSNKFGPTQNGLIQDAISAMDQLKLIKNDQDIKPIIFGRSLGGAVAFHIIQPLIKQYGINIGGVIIENSFTSSWDCVGNNFLYPFIADKWNNIQCIDKLKQENITNIPILFISAVHDTMLDPVMMKNLREHCQHNGKFKNIIWKEFQDCDHNDTYLSNGYTETFNSFIQFLHSKENKTEQN